MLKRGAVAKPNIRYTLVIANNEFDFLEELNNEIAAGAVLTEFNYDYLLDVDKSRKHIAKCEMFVALLEWKEKKGK